MDIDTRKLFYKINTALRNNQRLLKLLYFDTKDCLDKNVLTEEQIDMLFYGEEIQNQDGTTTTVNKRIFNQMSNPDMLTNMSSEIRFYPKFVPQNNLTRVLIFFEVITHTDIEQLNEGFSRSIEITKEIHKSLKNCNAIGKINFNNDFTQPIHFAKNFEGYMFTGVTRLNSNW